MSIRRSKLLPVLVLAFMLAGCGSQSTGHKSAEAVFGTVKSFAGAQGRVSTVNALWDQGTPRLNALHLYVVCKKQTHDCLLVAPDGAGYASLEDLVDDTKLIKPGDSLSAAGGLPARADTKHLETYTKTDSVATVWTAVGAVVAAAVLVVAVIWLFSRGRRRRDADRLLGEWHLSPGDGDQTR